MKRCRRCERLLPFSDFSPHRKTKDRLHTQCRACRAEHARRYYAENRDAVLEEQRSSVRRRAYNRAYSRRRKYGMAASEYEDRVAAQAGRCAICTSSDSALVVDHCHRTGVVRGLVCSGCNIGLGHFGDEPARLRAAADYLEGTRPVV